MPPRRLERVHLPRNERIKNGRIFEINKRANTGVIYLRCTTQFCIGTAKKLPNGNIISLREHSAICFEDRNAQLKADFLQGLKSAIERNFWKLKEVYTTIVALYPREIKIQVPYNSIVSSLKLWRRRCYPPCPDSLSTMANQLAQPEHQRLLEYDIGQLVSRPINDAEGHLHLLLYDPQFVRAQFAQVSHLFIDGTFQTTPRVTGVYQLVTFLGVKYDHAIPFAYILMSRKTQCSYNSVLNAIRTDVMNSESVRVVMTDFEHALRSASRTVFSNAMITGCSVHYDRALLKKIKSLRLTPLIRENETARLFLKKIMASAYLPSAMIEAEYLLLKNTLPAPLKREFANFLVYYVRQWLRVVKPAGFSVFGLSRRTNNVIESYNSVLADKLGQHPSAWTFVEKLIQLTSNAQDDLMSLRLNKRVRRQPRYATIYKQRELSNAWQKLNSGEITPTEFLDKAATLKGHVSDILMRIPDEPTEDEAELEEGQADIRLVNDPDYDENTLGAQNQNAVQHQESDSDGSDSISSVEPGSQNEDESDSVRSVNDGWRNEDADAESEMEVQDPEEDRIPEPLQAVNVESDLEDDILASDYILAPDDILAPDEILASDNNNPVLGPQAADMAQVNNNDSEDDVLAADNIPVLSPQAADTAQGNNNGDGPPAAAAQESNVKASSSRKKNLRKKRRRQMKANNNDGSNTGQVRPCGHKRRAKKKKSTQAGKCVVCRGNTATHGFFPCGHRCCCQRCGTIIDKQRVKKCPKCRAYYDHFIPFYIE